jgi:hypothetical protein
MERVPRFELEPDRITDEQSRFLDEHGFLIFSRVIPAERIQLVLAELDRIEARWLEERRRKVFGIPIYYGRDPGGRPYVQRFAFTSLFSEPISSLVNDPRFAAIRSLVGGDARIGEREKDGVVVNRYLNAPGSAYPRLGWHTDGLRDLFYFRMPKRMLNVGLHFDRCAAPQGGLRLIPGTHRQGFLSMLARKLYFISHRPDSEEIAIETEPGDLTVHDGRLWHRVARASQTGLASLRRTMYVPYLTDAYQPKDERSATPLYHRLGALVRGGP